MYPDQFVRRLLAIGSLALTGLGALACATESLTSDPCLTSPITVSPDRISFAVGDTVLMLATLTGAPQCLPLSLRMGKLRWNTTDSTVARISAVKGYLVAKGPGESMVTVYYPADSSVWGQVPVTVTP